MTRLMITALALALSAAATVAQDAAPSRAEIEDRLAQLETEQAELRDQLRALDDEPADTDRRPRRRSVTDGAPLPDPAVSAVLEDIDPNFRERLERLRRENPERARQIAARVRQRTAELQDLKQSDPAASFEPHAGLNMHGAIGDTHRLDRIHTLGGQHNIVCGGYRALNQTGQPTMSDN